MPRDDQNRRSGGRQQHEIAVVLMSPTDLDVVCSCGRAGLLPGVGGEVTMTQMLDAFRRHAHEPGAR